MFLHFFNFIFFSFLLIHLIIFRIKYDVWYTVVLIDSLWVIHTKIPFQVIPNRIGEYEFYDIRSLTLKKIWLGDSTDLSVILVYYLRIIVLCFLNNKSFIKTVFVGITIKIFFIVFSLNTGWNQFQYLRYVQFI